MQARWPTHLSPCCWTRPAAQALGAAGRKTVHEKFNAEIMAAQTAALCASAIESFSLS